MRLRKLLAWTIVLTFVDVIALGAEGIRCIGPNVTTGSSLAVVVENKGLVHTSQVFPRDEQGRIVGDKNATSQVARVLNQLHAAVVAAGGHGESIVKINAYVADPTVTEIIEAALAKQFSKEHKPAVSYVATRLPNEGCMVAMDAVASANSALPARVTLQLPDNSREAQSAVAPLGSLIYVAGQAEKGATLAQATRSTLESLQKTLKFLGRDTSDIVQCKSFFSPMSNVAEAQNELAKFFTDKPVPPTVWVEWTAPLIEIEVIAWGGEKKSGPAVEYLTPPGMTASPVYSRVARANSDRLIYFSGMYARMQTNGAGEVTDIFEQVAETLPQCGGDLKHLVKATYYCANNDASTKLNELRPKYYDPARPPAASKAMVNGVGRAARGLTIDLIAVPHD